MSPRPTMLPLARPTDKRAIPPVAGPQGQWVPGNPIFHTQPQPTCAGAEGSWLSLSLRSLASGAVPFPQHLRRMGRYQSRCRWNITSARPLPRSCPVPGRLTCNPPTPCLHHSPRPEPSRTSHGTRTQPKLRVGPKPLGWNSNPPSFH